MYDRYLDDRFILEWKYFRLNHSDQLVTRPFALFADSLSLSVKTESNKGSVHASLRSLYITAKNISFSGAVRAIKAAFTRDPSAVWFHLDPIHPWTGSPELLGLDGRGTTLKQYFHKSEPILRLIGEPI